MKDLIYFIPVVLLIGVGLAVPHVVKVGDVVCMNQNGTCSDYINGRSLKVKGMSISDAKSYLTTVFSKEAKVVNFTAKFRLPNKLLVWVYERKPAVAFRLGGSETYTLVDKSGKVLGAQTQVDLPLVVVERKISEEDVLFASGLMYDLFQMYRVNLGYLKSDGGLQIDNLDGKTVIFPLQGDRDILIGSLKAILSGLQLKPETSRIRQIDLRFKNPVLK